MSTTTNLSTLAQRALARDPALDAIEYGHKWRTWSDLRGIAERTLSLLAAAGVEPGQPIAFIPKNRPSAIAALLGMISGGHTIQMVYAFQSDASMAANLARLAPAAVIAEADLLAGKVDTFLQHSGMAALQISDVGVEVKPGFGATRVTSVGTKPPEIHILTSGTTGPPKQLPFTHDFFLTHHVLPRLSKMPEAAAYQEPPLLLSFPLGNITGIYSTLPPLLHGQRVVLIDRFNLEAWRDWVKRFSPRNAGLPPAGIQMILDADVSAEELASVQCIGTGAAPLDPSVQRRFEERYGIPILLSYGATEFGGPVTAMTLELHAEWGAKKLGSVGRVLPGAKLRIIDPETDAQLPCSQEGILEVVAPRMGPHWIRTSDVAILDEDGFLFHRGRADGAVMRGGFKLMPEVVERALLTHPLVADAAIVGRPDRRLGEVPVAAVVLRSGADWPGDAALEAHVRLQVPATHVPVAWRHLDELPRNPSMKLDRPGLKRMLESA